MDEAPRNGRVPVDALSSYGVVIRAGTYGAYTERELEAYEHLREFVARRSWYSANSFARVSRTL